MSIIYPSGVCVKRDFQQDKGETGETEGQSPCPKDTGTVPLSPLSPVVAANFPVAMRKDVMYTIIVMPQGMVFTSNARQKNILEGKERFMHKYLRAIGFSQYIRKKEIRELLTLVKQSPDSSLYLGDEGEKYGYLGKSFGENIGIRLFGEVKENGEVHEEYYYPYVLSPLVSSRQDCSVERHSDRLAFGGIIDDPGMGISLIFYLNNGIDYMYRQRQTSRPVPMKGVSLNGLCISGKILLPVKKTPQEKEKIKAAAAKRENLVEAAKNGDEEAMESLAAEDMSIFQNVSRRIIREDVYSIVDTCFMPYGLESDQYSVVGEILSVEKVRNSLTGEECWHMQMECNNIQITVTINTVDLLGAPAVGRRFKGDIWLQGTAIMD